MITVLFLAALVLSVGGKSLQKRDWWPTVDYTGGLSAYIGAQTRRHNWLAGAAVHADLNKPGIFDGARVHGSYRFDNGAEVGGYVEGYDGRGVGGGIHGSYQFNNGVRVNGHMGGDTERGFGAGLGVSFDLRKRSVSCVVACYEECKQDFDCLERCALTIC